MAGYATRNKILTLSIIPEQIFYWSSQASKEETRSTGGNSTMVESMENYRTPKQ